MPYSSGGRGAGAVPVAVPIHNHDVVVCVVLPILEYRTITLLLEVLLFNSTVHQETGTVLTIHGQYSTITGSSTSSGYALCTFGMHHVLFEYY